MVRGAAALNDPDFVKIVDAEQNLAVAERLRNSRGHVHHLEVALRIRSHGVPCDLVS